MDFCLDDLSTDIRGGGVKVPYYCGAANFSPYIY